MATMQDNDFEIDPITGVKKQKTPGAGTPPTATGAGAAYLKSVMDRLGGNDAVVKDAQNKSQASEAVQSYLAGQRARTTAAQAGFDPGTLQYQRVSDREQRLANESARDNRLAIGDLVRSRSAEALSAARDIETTEQKAIENLIGSLADNPVAQNYLRRVQAAGGDVRAAYETLFTGTGNAAGSAGPGAGDGTDAPPATGSGTGSGSGGLGTFANEFRPQTDAERELESIKDELRVGGFAGDINAEALRLYNQRKKDEQDGANRTREQNLIADARRIVENQGFDALSDEQREVFLKNVPIREASALPSTKQAIEDLVQKGGEGLFFKLGDTPYQIMDYHEQMRWSRGSGFSNRHSNWTKVKDLTTNQVKYVRSDGLILDYEPPKAPSGYKISYNEKTGRWEGEGGLRTSAGGMSKKWYDPVARQWRNA